MPKSSKFSKEEFWHRIEIFTTFSLNFHYIFISELGLAAWAVGDCCVSLEMLKSPHKAIYSFKLTMLWLSLSSSLSLLKYFNQYAHHNCGLRRLNVTLILHCASILISGKPPKAKREGHAHA